MTTAEAAFRAEVDEYCGVRPARLTIDPAGDGQFEINVEWSGHESVLRAVFVRRVLAHAGIEAQPLSSDGRSRWALRVGPVPAERVGELIDSCIR